MSEYDKLLDGADSLTIAELGELFMSIKTMKEEADGVKSELQKVFDRLRLQIIPDKMEDMGIDNVKITGVGRLGLTTDAYVGILPNHKEEAYSWLREEGHGDIIKPTVNSSSLKALLKEQVKEGAVLPDDLFKFQPFMRASVTKS